MKIKLLFLLLVLLLIVPFFYSGCNTAEENEADEGDYTINWTEPIKLCFYKGQSMFVEVVANGSNVHVFWLQDNTFSEDDPFIRNADVYYRRSFNNGNSWNESIRLTWTSKGKRNISVDIYEENIHLLADYFPRLLYARSKDNGNNWTIKPFKPIEDVSNTNATIKVNNHNIHVIFKAEGASMYSKVYYINSEDNGNTWNNSKLLSPFDWYCFTPKLAVNDNNLYAAWAMHNYPNEELYFQKSVDNGYSWSNPSLIVSQGSIPALPLTEAYESNIHIMGGSFYGGYYWRSIDNGQFWERKEGSCGEFLVIGNEIHRIPPLDSYGKTALSYSISADNGDSWTNMEAFKVEGKNWIFLPSFAVEGNYIHLVWTNLPYYEENNASVPSWVDTEIYYMRGEYEKK